MPESGVDPIFIAGGTGYLGRALVPELLRRGQAVRLLARRGSEKKAPEGCEIVAGDPLDARSFASRIAPAKTFVQLVGVPHPAPWKGPQFRAVDRVSALASLEAAVASRIAHFIYVSVAHPAPVMQAYWGVRAECEERIRASGLRATILRPWYVLGPGHRWAYALLPVYALLETLPPTRETALRLGMVRLSEMIGALVRAVEEPPETVRIVDVPAIRASRSGVS